MFQAIRNFTATVAANQNTDFYTEVERITYMLELHKEELSAYKKAQENALKAGISNDLYAKKIERTENLIKDYQLKFNEYKKLKTHV
jgi:hypothetical protein